jgi:hypothetical protein
MIEGVIGEKLFGLCCGDKEGISCNNGVERWTKRGVHTLDVAYAHPLCARLYR